MTAGPIDTYVRALSGKLPGPGPLRREMLEELHDGLQDAATAYRAAGLGPAEAERQAVADSGDLTGLAADYRSELAAASGIRTAALLAITMLGGLIAWDVSWSAMSTTWSASSLPPSVLVMSKAVDLAGLAGAGAAAVCVGLLVWSARIRAGLCLVNGALVAIGALCVAVIVAGSLGMNLSQPDRAAEMLANSAQISALGVGSILMTGAQVWALCRTARTTFARPRRSKRRTFARPRRSKPRTIRA